MHRAPLVLHCNVLQCNLLRPYSNAMCSRAPRAPMQRAPFVLQGNNYLVYNSLVRNLRKAAPLADESSATNRTRSGSASECSSQTRAALLTEPQADRFLRVSLSPFHCLTVQVHLSLATDFNFCPSYSSYCCTSYSSMRSTAYSTAMPLIFFFPNVFMNAEEDKQQNTARDVDNFFPSKFY
jgi:hypothetical protein